MSTSRLVIPLIWSVLFGCRVEDPLYCDSTTPCTDPARPYCDLEGKSPASEGIARTCVAAFVLEVEVAGLGTVTSEPAGITCSDDRSDCTLLLPATSTVSLVAASSAGWAFEGWSDARCGAGQKCDLIIEDNIRLVASFAEVPHRLTVVKTGEGTVRSTPEGIDCGEDCEGLFESNSSVSLVSEPDEHWRFRQWAGSERCGESESCALTMVEDADVRAVFERRNYTLSVSVTGQGAITSEPSGILCEDDCSESYPAESDVVLRATPNEQWRLSHWDSEECGTRTSCSVDLKGDRTVRATFDREAYGLTVHVRGEGVVRSIPAGINCGDDCSEEFASGTAVELTAIPREGWSFGAWGNCATVEGNLCSLTLNATTSVEAVFTRDDLVIGITLEGRGEGVITSSPPGIDCRTRGGGPCSASFPAGSDVSLTAEAELNSLFQGWNIAGCSGPVCTLPSLVDSRVVIAHFDREPAELVVATGGTGTGDVLVTTTQQGVVQCTSSPCRLTCDVGEIVSLSAHRHATSVFSGWTGACSGTSTCELTMPRQGSSVTATFEQIALRVMRGENGRIYEVGGDRIDCWACIGCRCATVLPLGAVITLQAQPHSSYRFAEWTGDCAGESSPTCTLVMDGPKTIGANWEFSPF